LDHSGGADHPFINPVTGYEQAVDLIPDALFGLEYNTRGKKSYRFFLVEADRGSEPSRSSRFNRKSHMRNFLQYREYVGHGCYKDHLGLTAGMLVAQRGQQRGDPEQDAGADERDLAARQQLHAVPGDRRVRAVLQAIGFALGIVQSAMGTGWRAPDGDFDCLEAFCRGKRRAEAGSSTAAVRTKLTCTPSAEWSFIDYIATPRSNRPSPRTHHRLGCKLACNDLHAW
jgi:hypothetical protein